MKQIQLFLFAIVIAFASCTPEDIVPIPDDPNNNQDNHTDTSANSLALWEYKIDEYDVLLTDLVLDNNDNSYFFAKADDKYFLYSLDKIGTLRWSQELPFGSYLNSGIMLAGDKLILSYQYDIIAAYNINNGTEIWSTTLSVSFSDMAYNDGIIYVAQTTTWDTESKISAIDAGTGAVKWDYPMDKHIDTKISVYKNAICVVSEFQLPWPFEIGLTILTDNGSSATEVWRHYQPRDNNPSEPIKPRRASFDGLGNIYYEESTTDTTYIHAHKVSDGTVNWAKKLCNFGLPEPAILFGNGKVTASYKSDESWGIVNSLITLDASTGNTENQNDDIILNDEQVLLTGDYSTVVFNRLVDDVPTMQLYSSSGDLVSSASADYLGWFVTSLSDCRISSEGNLIVIQGGDGIVKCIKAGLTQAKAGTWSCRKGTNANTNSINF